MVIWPDAIKAQNKIAAVSAPGSTVCSCVAYGLMVDRANLC